MRRLFVLLALPALFVVCAASAAPASAASPGGR